MFTGFSPETIDFLWGIRFNNNREWFNENKQIYQKTLYEPMKALAAEIEPAFSHVEGMKMHVSRIYRDMRMHPPVPYKDSLWMCLRHAGGPWLENPGLCFEISPEGYRYGFLLWGMKAPRMELLRQKIRENPDKFLSILREGESKSGIPLSGKTYARPKPCEDTRLLPYFRLKNFIAIEEAPADDLLFSPELAEHLRKVLLAWLPMYEFCRI